jgi:hypothetical protein
VWALRATGVIGSFLACAAIGAVLSLAACHVAARVWERRPGTGDVLFGDLMIWGWARRVLQQRRLEDAVATLGLRRTPGASDPLTISVERRAAMLERLAGALEARDPYTHGHSRRVARYASMIAKRLGVGGAELARIRTAAAVHDVGKIETPIEILHKPSGLTDAEFDVVKQHPVAGERMVEILEDDALAAIVRHHHERLDGSGYPDRLNGPEIPLGARIIAVADTFDAITSARPYRDAKPHHEALAILRAEAGTKLDRDAVTAFCSIYRGRRLLGAWVAFTDVADRVLTWLVPDALGTTARTVALAATAAAVGGGAALVPVGSAGAQAGGPAQPRTSLSVHAARAPLSATAVRPSGTQRTGRAVLAAGARATGHTHRALGAGSRIPGTRHHRVTIAPLPGGAPANASGPGQPDAPAPASGSPSGLPAGTPDVTVTGGAAGVSAGASGSASPAGLHVTVGGDPSSGSSSGSGISVSAGQQGVSAGVQVGGSSGPSVSAGVTVGGGSGSSSGDAGTSTGSATPSVGASVTTSGSGLPSVDLHANVPGIASLNLHAGG